MLILGLSAYYHDSAAAILEDGQIRAAAQQERFSRTKHDPEFPIDAARYCLDAVGAGPDDLTYVAFYDKPLAKAHRLLASHAATAPGGYPAFRAAASAWLGDKIHHRRNLESALRALGATRRLGRRLVFADHHQSHAASAFFPSPFADAAILTVDGVGEWKTTSIGHGRGATIQGLQEIRFPHSLGLLYAAFTAHLGFKVNSGEYKVMGLAPYGEPRFVDEIREHLIDLRDDGSFRLDLSYFGYVNSFSMTTPKFEQRFGARRHPEAELAQQDLDLAASIQRVTEDAVLGLAAQARRLTRSSQLVLAGGVALNCVANGRVVRESGFDEVWVQPAAGDAGGALGAAYVAHHALAGKPRSYRQAQDQMQGSYLGPSFSDGQIVTALDGAGVVYERLGEQALITRTVDALESGRAVGWFQGRAEFGPRALGARSILADPRSAMMQRTLNLRVKHRESFRPFAPSVLAEHASSWFDLEVDSPYMLVVAQVAQDQLCDLDDDDAMRSGLERLQVARSTIPAVTHVDGSARVQTVHAHTNPLYHKLLSAWFDRTGCPVLVNTSFNVRGEPIVNTPEDALACFLGTDIETLIIGNQLLDKENQTVKGERDHHRSFALD